LAPTPVRLFLVDDHAIVREGLATVLAQAGFAICGQAGDIQETLGHSQLASASLVIVDLTLREDDGVELIRALRERGLSSVVYSMHEDPNIVRNAFAAGAAGYVTKREVASCLVEAVVDVLAGRQYVSPRAGVGLARPSAVANQRMTGSGFSEQQQRVYEMLGDGLGPQEIAQTLNVSPRTVESYAARMIEKLDVAGMKELRRRAIVDRRRAPGNPLAGDGFPPPAV
jgi:DNA-binding NarL/FixJ family response regulator